MITRSLELSTMTRDPGEEWPSFNISSQHPDTQDVMKNYILPLVDLICCCILLYLLKLICASCIQRTIRDAAEVASGLGVGSSVPDGPRVDLRTSSAVPVRQQWNCPIRIVERPVGVPRRFKKMSSVMKGREGEAKFKLTILKDPTAKVTYEGVLSGSVGKETNEDEHRRCCRKESGDRTRVLLPGGLKGCGPTYYDMNKGELTSISNAPGEDLTSEDSMETKVDCADLDFVHDNNDLMGHPYSVKRAEGIMLDFYTNLLSNLRIKDNQEEKLTGSANEGGQKRRIMKTRSLPGSLKGWGPTYRDTARDEVKSGIEILKCDLPTETKPKRTHVEDKLDGKSDKIIFDSHNNLRSTTQKDPSDGGLFGYVNEEDEVDYSATWIWKKDVDRTRVLLPGHLNGCSPTYYDNERGEMSNSIGALEDSPPEVTNTVADNTFSTCTESLSNNSKHLENIMEMAPDSSICARERKIGVLSCENTCSIYHTNDTKILPEETRCPHQDRAVRSNTSYYTKASTIADSTERTPTPNSGEDETMCLCSLIRLGSFDGEVGGLKIGSDINGRDEKPMASTSCHSQSRQFVLKPDLSKTEEKPIDSASRTQADLPGRITNPDGHVYNLSQFKD